MTSKHLDGLVRKTRRSDRHQFLRPAARYELVVVSSHIVLIFHGQLLARKHSTRGVIPLIF